MKLTKSAMNELIPLMYCAKSYYEASTKTNKEIDRAQYGAYFSGINAFARVFKLNLGKIFDWTTGENQAIVLPDMDVDKFFKNFGWV